MDIESSSGSILTFFKPDTLAPIALVIGIICVMFIKKEASKNVGMIALGFGVLFMGLIGMTDAVDPLSSSDAFADILSRFSNMPILGLLAGLVLTVIVQSSSAMVGILQALSSTGALTFELVYPIIMGINIGTCVTTALVCSIGTSKNAKRTGIVHIIFNIIGTILFMIAMTILRKVGFMPNLWEGVVDSGIIANFQTIFNLITAIVLLPFTGLLVKAACAIVKDGEEVRKDINDYPELDVLDSKLMINPPLALAEATNIAIKMAQIAQENIDLSLKQFEEFDEERSKKIAESENKLDCFTDSNDHYLIELSNHIKNINDKRQHGMLMQCISDIERIGDYASNFDELARKKLDTEVTFSESAVKEFSIIRDAIAEIIRLTIEAMTDENDYVARRIEPLEEVIDDMVLLLKNRHRERLCKGICSINGGLIFLDVLTYLERTADQCSSIAMLLLGKNNAEIAQNHHLYMQELHNSTDQSYLAEQENRRAQYLTPLKSL